MTHDSRLEVSMSLSGRTGGCHGSGLWVRAQLSSRTGGFSKTEQLAVVGLGVGMMVSCCAGSAFSKTEQLDVHRYAVSCGLGVACILW